METWKKIENTLWFKTPYNFKKVPKEWIESYTYQIILFYFKVKCHLLKEPTEIQSRGKECTRKSFSFCMLHIFCHVSTRKKSTHDNRHVPLSGSQFFRLQPRTRKAYDISTRLKIIHCPMFTVYIYILRFYRKFSKISFKIRLSPCPRKTV